MNNNQSLKNIKKEIKTISSLLDLQESLIEDIITDGNNKTDASKKNKNKVPYR